MEKNRTGNASNHTIAKRWAKSVGRCEYDGCNKLLYKADLTSEQINCAYVAHIIADSPDGPGGDVAVEFVFEKAPAGTAFAGRELTVAIVDEDFHRSACVCVAWLGGTRADRRQMRESGSCRIPNAKIVIISEFAEILLNLFVDNINYSEMKKEFDQAIKEFLMKGNPAFNQTYFKSEEDYGGIDVKGNENPVYFKNQEGIKSLLGNKVSSDILAGKGNEIQSRAFFSVASSCRFAVACFTELCGEHLEVANQIGGVQIKADSFKMEKECGIKHIGGYAPQMDVFFETEGMATYFFEVKCHELFDRHSLKDLSYQYGKKYFRGYSEEKLISPSDTLFAHWDKSKGNVNLRPQDFGIEGNIIDFDLKQFICHLLGVISYRKEHNDGEINFYYLFYHNSHKKFEDTYSALHTEIVSVYKAFAGLFEYYDINFGYMYNDEFDALKTLKPTWSPKH